MRMSAGLLHWEHGFEYVALVTDGSDMHVVTEYMRQECLRREPGWLPCFLWDFQTNDMVRKWPSKAKRKIGQQPGSTDK